MTVNGNNALVSSAKNEVVSTIGKMFDLFTKILQ